MVIIASTDNKYLGKEINHLEVGDTIQLDDFVFNVSKINVLESGLICFSNPNYQLLCEE